jgi:plastocyanin
MRIQPAIFIAMLMLGASLVACREEQTVTPVPTPAAGEGVVESPGTPPVEPPVTAACRVSPDAPTVTVEMRDFTFDPPEIEAAPGEVIGWTNAGSTPHTATMQDGQCTTPTIPAGEMASLVFEGPGTFPYLCDIHPAMTGVITITE